MAAYALTDHDQIQRWAEQRGARPACVKRTGGEGDVGIIRIDFPGFSGEESLETIDWQAWFDKFERQNLALLVDETGESNFNKLVRRAAEAAGGVAVAPNAGADDDADDAEEDADDAAGDDEDADLEEDDLDEDDEDDDFDEDDEDEEDAADGEEESNQDEK